MTRIEAEIRCGTFGSVYLVKYGKGDRKKAVEVVTKRKLFLFQKKKTRIQR